MDIFLSVNNRAEVMQIPVMPSEFKISKPQTTEHFETVSGEEFLLVGAPKLKTIAFSSFFPIKPQPYIHHQYNPNMWGWDYVGKLDEWIKKKLPIRLIITYERSDTPINLAVGISKFDYSIKSDGDLWYAIEFEQMNLLGNDNPIPWYGEEELDMDELEKLRTEVAQLTQLVQRLANPQIYNKVDSSMPQWAHEAVNAAVQAGVLKGDGGGLNLDYQDLRHLVMLHRAGVF